MTAATYDMLGWEADLWIPARRTQTRVLLRSNWGRTGGLGSSDVHSLNLRKPLKVCSLQGESSRIVSLLPVKRTRQTS